MDEARDALNRLLGSFIGFAEEMLAKHGEFYPYAGVMQPSGDLVSIGYGDDDPPPSTADVLAGLRLALSADAAAGRVVATALIYDCRVTLPDAAATSDAIAIELDHVSGSSIVCYLPYGLAGGTLRTGDIFSSEGANAVFGAG